MNKMSLLLVLLSVYAVHASDGETHGFITMPNEAVLRERLILINQHFVDNTNIIAELAGQSKPPMGIAILVDCHFHDYMQCLKKT